MKISLIILFISMYEFKFGTIILIIPSFVEFEGIIIHKIIQKEYYIYCENFINKFDNIAHKYLMINII